MLKFRTSKSVIKDLEPRLIELKTRFKTIQKENDKFSALISLFDLMSKMEDEKSFYNELRFLEKRNNKKFETKKEALNKLCFHIARCGRDKYGMNRTNYGEPVTAEKVFLGDIFGIFTLSLSQCFKDEKQLKQEKRYDLAKDSNNPPTDWYLLHDHQAGSFVNTHTKESLEAISVLLS